MGECMRFIVNEGERELKEKMMETRLVKRAKGDINRYRKRKKWVGEVV